MPTRLDLITLVVQDMPRMLTFYTEVLGFEVKRNRGGWVSLQNEGVRLALWESKGLQDQFPKVTFPSGLNGSMILAINFPTRSELKEAFDRMTAQGAEALSPVSDYAQWQMQSGWIADPEGNMIEITCHDA